ncbi:class I SAM-dependent methyltransferase [Candidatus Woesearchaeota archaeon]|nr:class I SAM-dependent methyltransferase [Candidatus Woesearchaeota archaeon]
MSKESWLAEAKEWSRFAEGYDDEVYSVTKVPERLEQIMARVKRGRVLNLGAGSTSHLNRALIKDGNTVVASDFNSDMLRVARRRFQHPNLEYRHADSRDLEFGPETFDTAVSVNSILSENRKDVQTMIDGVYRVIKYGGVFVAFMPSYHNVVEARKNLDIACELDPDELRVMDTTGWQCFHTPVTIHKNLRTAGFSSHTIEVVLNTAEEELRQFDKLYFPTTGPHRERYLKSPMYLYLVTANKESEAE